MAPRIVPITDPDADQRASLSKTFVGPDGQPLGVFTTLAHQPRLLRRVNALGGYFMAHGSVGARAREIVILRTAARCRSAYEEGQHRLIGADAGLSPAEVNAAIEAEIDHPWSDEDRTLLEFTDELLEMYTVSDATWEALGRWYDDGRRVELTVLVGFYRMLAGFLNAIGVELDATVVERLADGR